MIVKTGALLPAPEDHPISDVRPRDFAAPALLALCVALIARAALGLAPFPSVDDYAYGALALHAMDPSLFPRDDLLLGFSNHALIYTTLFRVFTHTVGVGAGFAIATLLLSLATALGVLALLRALGGKGFATPLVFALVVLVSMPGIGRGAYGGLFGNQFHGQWLSLCVLLFAFAALLQQRVLTTGLLLAAAAYAHPMVAMHGAFAVLCAGLANGRSGLLFTARVAAISAVASVPMMIYIATNQPISLPAPDVPAWTIVNDGLRFRAPHHYLLSVLALFLVGAWTLVGALSAWGRARTALGILAGLAALQALGALIYALEPPLINAQLSLLAHIFDLTRSSPLLIGFAAMLYAAALERGLRDGLAQMESDERFRLVTATTLVLAMLFINGTPIGWLVAGASIGTVMLAQREASFRPVLALWAVAAVALTWDSARITTIYAPLESSETELYTWAAEQTRDSTLFITPPSMQGFRYYAKRSQFADFKLFSMAQPSQGWAVRQRLELIAAPDDSTREAVGWPGMVQWDRSYAVHNTPERVAQLLAQTGADFLIYDMDAGAASILESAEIDGAGLEVAFSNARYVVLSRR